ncbi:MAG: hypothetical protein GWO24_10690, partial [Akkermansiaceae bacterium]|nr:hypothetical protein [Akkermansiaceae bacterium]
MFLSAWPLLKNAEYSGSPGGTAIYAVFKGLGASEDDIMRTYDVGEMDTRVSLQNLPLKIIRTIMLQAGDLYPNLGSLL